MNLNLPTQAWHIRFPTVSGLYIVTLRTGKKTVSLYYCIGANDWRLPNTDLNDKSAIIPNSEIVAWLHFPAPLEI